MASTAGHGHSSRLGCCTFWELMSLPRVRSDHSFATIVAKGWPYKKVSSLTSAQAGYKERLSHVERLQPGASQQLAGRLRAKAGCMVRRAAGRQVQPGRPQQPAGWRGAKAGCRVSRAAGRRIWPGAALRHWARRRCWGHCYRRPRRIARWLCHRCSALWKPRAAGALRQANGQLGQLLERALNAMQQTP